MSDPALRLVDPGPAPTERKDDDRALRPRTLDEIIGQSRVVRNLRIYCGAATMRKETVDHCLLVGPPGLGKTTLAHIIANAMGGQIRITSAPAIGDAGTLAAFLTGLRERDVFFIDEIHRLDAGVEETLYSAMEDFAIDVPTPEGPTARVPLPRFTLVGATTRSGSLTSPLRDRFGITERLEYYTSDELRRIVERSATILRVGIDEEGAREIGQRARGTPRIANRLLRRVRDFATVAGDGHVSKVSAADALDALEVDDAGLDRFDRGLLSTIIERFGGGPVGLETLSIAVSEDQDTITDVYEPFLIQGGWIQRTPRGRVATVRAYDHLRLPRRTIGGNVVVPATVCGKCRGPVGSARITGQPPDLCAPCHSAAGFREVATAAAPEVSDPEGGEPGWIQEFVEAYAFKVYGEGSAQGVRFFGEYNALRARLRQQHPGIDLESATFIAELQRRAAAWWNARPKKGKGVDW